MNSFKQYLINNYKKYPNATLQDYFKLIYQSEFAGGHMIDNKKSSLKYLTSEYSNITPSNIELYEFISSEIIRINLQSYKFHNLDLSYLNDLFFQSANLTYQNKYLNDKIDLLHTLSLNKQIIINNYQENLFTNFKQNPQAMHHSETYRSFYDPHYRIINYSLLPIEFKILKLQNYINQQPKDKLTIIALEGRCASGKTTITKALQNVTIIHADDFFSKTDLLDFDALDNVLKKLKLNERLEYTIYNCMNNTYSTKTIEKVANVVIVEGVYSYHKRLRNHYQKLVFLESTKEAQLPRLQQRTQNEQLMNKFINIWIPREENYYNENNLIIESDIII